MLMWLYEALAPAVLVRHISLLLLVAAMAMPTVFLLRVLALASGVVALVLAVFLTYDGVATFWEALLIAVIVIRLVMGTSRSFGRQLSAEEKLFQEKAVPTLGPAQVRKLLTAGSWRDVWPGTTLTRQGEAVSELCFIVRGTVDIMVDGQKVAECGPGTLIGEIGLSTGESATATAVCATPVHYLGFEAKRLYPLLDNHFDLQDAIELAIQRSTREKLHRANIASAHPSVPTRR
jgi:CRP-like cAMP-binding protein